MTTLKSQKLQVIKLISLLTLKLMLITLMIQVLVVLDGEMLLYIDIQILKITVQSLQEIVMIYNFITMVQIISSETQELDQILLLIVLRQPLSFTLTEPQNYIMIISKPLKQIPMELQFMVQKQVMHISIYTQMKVMIMLIDGNLTQPQEEDFFLKTELVVVGKRILKLLVVKPQNSITTTRRNLRQRVVEQIYQEILLQMEQQEEL